MYGNLIVFCIIIFSTESQSPDPPEYSEEDPYPYEDLITFDENRRRRPWSLTPPPACVAPSSGHEICVPPVWGESPWISCSRPVYHVPGVPQALGYSLRPMSTDLGLLQLPLDVYEGPIQQRLSTMQIRGSRRGEQSPTSPCRHHHH